MHTEAEAKAKWCQETYALPEQRSPDGEGIRQGGPWTCCASGCMAWRWDANQTPASVGETWELWDARNSEKRRGYCGKAGVP